MMAINETAGPALRAPAPVQTYPCIANSTAHFLSNPIQAFAAAMVARKIIPPTTFVADGGFHRCDVEGKHGKGDGSYCLHLDGLPAGGFENWCDGLGWQNWSVERTRPLTPGERRALAAHINAMKRQHDAEQRQRHVDAAAKAATRWAAAVPVAAHPYLSAKGVQAHGVRADAAGALLVDMRDTDGNLWNIERINPLDFTDKRGLYGGRTKGCYHAIGRPSGKLVICEGYATGATIHEDTGFAVAVAFNAGNLMNAAMALRAKFPFLTLIVAADDDWQTEGNPGVTKARAAAASVGGLLAVPDFTGLPRGPKDTDFNDLHRLATMVEVQA